MLKRNFSVATMVAAMLTGALAQATPPLPPPASNQIVCASPVGRNDSAAALIRRFGANARKEKVPGAEGEEFEALVLYPRDPQRRIEVAFADDKMLRPSSVTVRGTSSAWALAGLRLGDGLEQVTQRNGRGFALSGFEWDYGGYVTDLKGGALAQLPGGCTVTVRFSLPANLMSTPEVLMGDKSLQSSGPILRRTRPVVSELALNFR
jgi:hypothetical protein